MAGEGAKYSPFARLINVVLSFQPKRERFRTAEPLENIMTGTPEAAEYGRAVRIAGLKAAVYLAEVTKALEPGQVERYALNGEMNDLSKVVYVYQMQSPFVYGEVAPAGGAIAGAAHLPTIIHPNEILDGALVNSFTVIACMREVTYLIQNHRLIQELYWRHGRELDFGGVVLYTNGDSVKTKDRLSSYVANLATLLEADGAVLNYLGGGHPIVDVMMTCEKLEKRGVKTTLLLMEMAVNPEDSGHVHFVREADAIVSTGNYEQRVELGPMPRVLGGSRILETNEEAAGPLNVPLRHILASTHQFGGGTLRGRGY
jgi:glycine reductase